MFPRFLPVLFKGKFSFNETENFAEQFENV